MSQMLFPLSNNSTPDYSAMGELDWTFEAAETRRGAHGAHPYPAKFIPQIPRALIERLHPGDDSYVLDPFCGSGTTLVEAALAGKPTVGIDLHPLACLITKVKTRPSPPGLLRAARDVLARVEAGVKHPVPDIPRVDHWFKPEVQQALASLTYEIRAVEDISTRDALKVALSSIIVRVSNQESDTRYAAIENGVTEKDVYELFARAVSNLDSALTSTWPPLVRVPPSIIVNQNVLTVRPQDLPRPISLAVTSPPYPNAYEYWLYHKYRMYWLGMDPIPVREREIGARPHYFRRKPATAQDFEDQMSQVFQLLNEVLVPGGHACFQVGDSKIHGEIIDNAALLQRAAATAGFSTEATFARKIPLHRKAFNPTNSRIRKETIIVFRREAP